MADSTFNTFPNIEVLHQSQAHLGIGTKFTLSKPITNYRIIIIEAFATIYANSTQTRKFSTVTTQPYIDNDVGDANRYIDLSVYYNSSYNACLGLKINSATELQVAESITAGYSQIWGINVYGIK